MFWKRLNYKYYFLVILIYTFFLAVIMIVSSLSLERIYKQLNYYSLDNTKYVIEVNQSVKQNDYLNCSSVTFYCNEDLNNSLYTENFMIINDTNYQETLPFYLSKPLGEREIAVSYNIAKEYRLTKGSIIYSKNNIINQVLEYKVVEIIPICYGVLKVDYKLNHGIIIMGYDETYEENVENSYISFCANDPTKLIQENKANLISFINISEQKKPLLNKFIINLIIGILVIILFTIVYKIIHKKLQTSYYEYLAIKGSPIKKIKFIIFLDIIIPGAISLLIASIISVVVISKVNYYFSGIISLILMMVASVTLLILSVICSLRGGIHKWR